MRKRIAVLGMLIFIYAAISTVAALGDETSLHKAAIDLADRYRQST